MIEKSYRTFDSYDAREAVFGYALCLDCHASLGESFSVSSKRKCQRYLYQRIDLRKRTAALLRSEPIDPSEWIQHCIVHDTPKADLKEYQLLAHCYEDDMLLSHLPLMIGGPAIEELVQRLSNETLDELGDFRNQYFGLPPKLKASLQGPLLA